MGQAAPCEESVGIVKKAIEKFEETRARLEEIGIEAACLVTLRLCTIFLEVGVVEKNLPVGKLAALMMRDECTGFAELSWLESRVQQCAEAVGTACRVEENDRRDQVL